MLLWFLPLHILQPVPTVKPQALAFLQAQRESVFAKEDQAKKDAFDESDDESAISRTESELREVTKVILHHTLRLLSSQDSSVITDCEAAVGHWENGGCKGPASFFIST